MNLNLKLFFQAITNIIDNAKKFSKDSEIKFTYYNQEKKNFIIEIRDYGTGISKQDLPFVFNRFYKGKYAENLDGEGLGLSIANEILILHNGKIEISSELQKGTKVLLKLPIIKNLD